jgi:Carbohydrate-binding module 48 (Isoamylase N-terminal domain)
VDKRKVDEGTVLVGFELPAAVDAQTVSVCGDFNGWVAQTHPLTRLGDGRFRTEISLPAGDRWRFRYLLDGARWENDWAADDYVPNGLGDDDSVVDLTNPSGLPVIDLTTPPAVTDGAATDAAAADGVVTDAAAADVATEVTDPAEHDMDGDVPAELPSRGRFSRWWRRRFARRERPAADPATEDSSATADDAQLASSSA